MKKGSRFLGIDDAPLEKEKIVGVLYRGTEFIEQLETLEVEKDSGEGTNQVLELYNKFNSYIEAVLVDGISFAGFNVIDIEFLSKITGKPFIAVTGNRPDRKKFSEAMEKLGLSFDMEKLPEVHEVELSTGRCFIQFSGCSLEEAEDVLEASTIQGNIPECIRQQI